MAGRRTFLLLLALCVACNKAPEPGAATKPGAGPQFNATVVSIRTTAGEKTTDHELLIANGRARSTAEQDVWRLYDTKANTVTTVDDVEKTIRTDELPSLLQKRGKALAGSIPSHFPRARLTRGERKPILGANAQQTVIQVGAYRRELWLGDHPAIPDELFALMLAADAPSSPLAPMMQRVDEELLRVRGFPLLDRAEVPLGNGKNVVERAVTAVAQRQVNESLLTIPRGYKDITPKPAPPPTKNKKK